MPNDMTGFDTRLTAKLEELHMTQADLCRLTGLASSMISHYCTGQRIPSVPTAAKIAKALNTNVGAIIVAEEEASYTTKTTNDEKSDKAQMLIRKFRALNEEGRKKVLTYTDDLLSSGKYK